MSDEWSVALHSADDDTQSAPYWRVRVRPTYSGPPGQTERLDQWIDARRCPEVLEAAEALRRFDPPAAYEPAEVGKAARFAPHGARFVLTTTGASNGGQVTTTTTDETGRVLGELARQTLSRLRACIV